MDTGKDAPSEAPTLETRIDGARRPETRSRGAAGPFGRRPLVAAVAGVLVVALVVAFVAWRRSPVDPPLVELDRPEAEIVTPSPLDPALEGPPSPNPVDAPSELDPDLTEEPRDPTDERSIARLVGVWYVEVGAAPPVAVRLTERLVETTEEGGVVVKRYAAESSRLPDRYTFVTLPGGGNFLAFFRGGEPVEVWEHVRFRPESFTFTHHATGRPGVAYRTLADRRAATDPRGKEPDRPDPPEADPAPRPGSPYAAPPALPTEPPPAPLPSPAPSRDVDAMWRDAERLRRAERYDSLIALLNEILTVEPRNRKARRWARDVASWRRDQEEDLVDDVLELLEDFEDDLEDRDLDDVLELWRGGPDGATVGALRDVVDGHRDLRVVVRLEGTEVRDGVAWFVAAVRVTGRPRSGGPSRRILDVRWRGQVAEGGFVGPFP